MKKSERRSAERCRICRLSLKKTAEQGEENSGEAVVTKILYRLKYTREDTALQGPWQLRSVSAQAFSQRPAVTHHVQHVL